MTFDLAEMRPQLEKGADVDETLDAFGHTALYLACEHGRRRGDALNSAPMLTGGRRTAPRRSSSRAGMGIWARRRCASTAAAVDRAAEGGATPSRA
mmetsp:Transcript_12272/g.37815  ORF Transcript_12272/g.37815 Transcript_12272/m.37815 type:complete len:96 (-) Transcript_12272:345-632(-)